MGKQRKTQKNMEQQGESRKTQKKTRKQGVSGKNIEKREKTGEIVQKHEKTGKNIEKHGETGENVEKHRKTGRIRGNHTKTRKNRENQGKTQKNMGKQGNAWGLYILGTYYGVLHEILTEKKYIISSNNKLRSRTDLEISRSHSALTSSNSRIKPETYRLSMLVYAQSRPKEQLWQRRESFPLCSAGEVTSSCGLFSTQYYILKVFQ